MKRYCIFIVAIMLSVFLIEAPTKSMAKDTEEDVIKIFNAKTGEFEKVDKIVKDKEELRDVLTDEQFDVTQKQATERPFTGQLLDNKGHGVYKCVVCGLDLFGSDAKYDSGTGWPSFSKPIAEENIGMREDDSSSMRRVEVYCPRCGAHMGHVFEDGPSPTNQRFCINSAALKFQPMEKND